MKAISTIIKLTIMSALASCGDPHDDLTSIVTGEGIAVSEGDRDVLFYQVSPKSLDGRFERAGYVHPVYSLAGTIITEDFPPDHRHHHGIFAAWHQILRNGEPVADGWTGENISWDVVETSVEPYGESIVISSEVDWTSSLGGQTVPIVREGMKITVNKSTDKFRIIDYQITVRPLEDNIFIGGSDDEKGYGGFSLRLNLPADVAFTGRGGEVVPQVGPVDAGPWMNITGSFDGEGRGQSGVLVICHPSNPRGPEPWILRKEKSMQNPAFPGRESVPLPEKGIVLKYRTVIHNGLVPEEINRIYKEYAGANQAQARN